MLPPRSMSRHSIICSSRCGQIDSAKLSTVRAAAAPKKPRV
jgi:hypothetical protein